MRSLGIGLGLWIGSGRRYLPWLAEGGPSTWPLVLLSDRGLSLVEATVADPNDISTASWAVVAGIASRTATTLTEDTSNGYHSITQNPVPGLVVGKPATASAIAKYNGDRNSFAISLGSSYSFFNLSTGQVGASSGLTPAISALGGNEYLCTVTGNPLGAAQLTFNMANGNTSSYQGVAGYSIGIRSVTVTQRNVSATADTVTGNGRSMVNAVGTAQPLYRTTASFGGKASLYFPATTWLTDATLSIAQPFTIYVVASGAGTATNYRLVSSETNDNIAIKQIGTDLTMYAGTALAAASTSLVTPSVLACVFNGASSVMYKKGVVIASGDAGTNPISGLSWGCYPVTPAQPWLADGTAMLVHSGADDAGRAARVSNWLARQYGL